MSILELKDLDLSLKESRDIVEFMARKRGINNYQYMSNDELLSTLKNTRNFNT